MKNFFALLWLLKATTAKAGTTLAPSPSPGGSSPTKTAKTTQSIVMQSCAQVTAAVASAGFCPAAASVMKTQTGASNCVSVCTHGATCPAPTPAPGGRRLSETGAHARQLSTPSVAVAYTITFPAGTSLAQATAAINNVNPSTFKTAFTAALTAAGGATAAFASQVQSTSQPTTPTVSIPGYDSCVSGAACYFNFYAVNEHYKIHRVSHTPAFSDGDCSSACTADATCEAYEYLTSPNTPACSFWTKGACNIPAGSPPGYVTGITYANFCDKVGARSAFTPVTSNCKNSNILGLGSLLSAFLMLGMMG